MRIPTSIPRWLEFLFHNEMESRVQSFKPDRAPFRETHFCAGAKRKTPLNNSLSKITALGKDDRE